MADTSRSLVTKMATDAGKKAKAKTIMMALEKVKKAEMRRFWRSVSGSGCSRVVIEKAGSPAPAAARKAALCTRLTAVGAASFQVVLCSTAYESTRASGSVSFGALRPAARIEASASSAFEGAASAARYCAPCSAVPDVLSAGSGVPEPSGAKARNLEPA